MKEIIKLLRYIKGYWKDTILTWVCVLFECVAEGLVAYFMQFFIDEVKDLSVNPENLDAIFMYSGIIAGMAILAAATIQGAFQMIIRAVVRAPFLMLFALVMCFVTYWQAALVFLVFIPLAGLKRLKKVYIHQNFPKE